MKLGTQTGSLTNWIMSAGSMIEVEVGMGATILCWTDRHAATVIAWDGKTLTVQTDKCERTDSNGMSDAQQYRYARNVAGEVYRFRRRRNGQWCEVSKSEVSGRFVFQSRGLSLGERCEFHDFSF